MASRAKDTCRSVQNLDGYRYVPFLVMDGPELGRDTLMDSQPHSYVAVLPL